MLETGRKIRESNYIDWQTIGKFTS